MYSTSVNYYIPRQTVVLYSGSSPRRYQTVYAKNLKIHKGIDNQLQFQFLNQDQKPVDITGKTINCRLMSYDGSEVILQKALTLLYPVTGIATLQVLSSETLKMDATLCYYSLTIPDGAFEYPVFVDDSAGGRGVIDVINSVLPKSIPSVALDIPNHATPTEEDPVTFYSAPYTPGDTSFFTFQTQLTGYIGTLRIQGSPSGSNTEWFYISEEVSYSGYTSTDYLNIEGYFPRLRVEFYSLGGTINQLLVR